MPLNITQNIKIACGRPRPFRYLLAKSLVKTGLCKYFTIYRDGYRLRFFPSSLSLALWEGGELERKEDEDIIDCILGPGDTYVDVGANIGALAILGKNKVGSRGVVVAIEAHPKTFVWLNENIKFNNLSIKTENFAVGETFGQITFSDTISDDMNSVAIGGESGLNVDMKTS